MGAGHVAAVSYLYVHDDIPCVIGGCVVVWLVLITPAYYHIELACQVFFWVCEKDFLDRLTGGHDLGMMVS